MTELITRLNPNYINPTELFWFLVVITIAFVVHELRLWWLERKLNKACSELSDRLDAYQRSIDYFCERVRALEKRHTDD